MVAWLRRCVPQSTPHTVESIASHFVEKHLPSGASLDAVDAARVADVYDSDPWFAWRRRICALYGVATCYCDPRGTVAKRGWNRRLWANHGDVEPERLVELIFDVVIELLQNAATRPDMARTGREFR